MTASLAAVRAPLADDGALAARVHELEHAYALLGARDLVKSLISKEFEEGLALVSSFGSGSAVMLHMAAQADPDIPVLFLDTEKHFGETKRYRDQLVELLGLTDVRSITPDPVAVDRHDPQGILWSQQPDDCCFIRKVAPLQRALGDFDAWFTGRRRDQNAERDTLPRFEAADGRIKINALANWTQQMVDDYFEEFKLPRHPLEADGYLSIGCMTCTDRVAEGEDARAGRWRGSNKSECGIHVANSNFSDYGANI